MRGQTQESDSGSTKRLEDIRATRGPVPRTLDAPLRGRLRRLIRHKDRRRIETSRPNLKPLLVIGVGLAAAYKADLRFDYSFMIGVLAAVALSSTVILRILHEWKLRRSLAVLARTGELVLAGIVIANNRLWEGTTEILPGAAVFTLDEQHRFDREWLSGLSQRLYRMREEENAPAPGEEAVWRFIRDDYATGCLRIPASICGNDRTFVADILIDPSFLPGGRIEDSLMPAIADPERKPPLQVTLLPL